MRGITAGFLRHRKAHHRKADDTISRGAAKFTDAFKALRKLYDDTAMDDFDLFALKAIRQEMIDTVV